MTKKIKIILMTSLTIVLVSGAIAGGALVTIKANINKNNVFKTIKAKLIIDNAKHLIPKIKIYHNSYKFPVSNDFEAFNVERMWKYSSKNNKIFDNIFNQKSIYITGDLGFDYSIEDEPYPNIPVNFHFNNKIDIQDTDTGKTGEMITPSITPSQESIYSSFTIDNQKDSSENSIIFYCGTKIKDKEGKVNISPYHFRIMSISLFIEY